MDQAGGILQVVERLYAAAMAPAEWSGALADLSVLLRADHTVLHASGPTGAPLLSVAGIEVSEVMRAQAAAQHVVVREPLTPASWQNGRATLRSILMSDREFERTALYNELVRPVDGFYSLGARREMPEASLLIASCRSRRVGDFDDASTATLQAVLPHLANAIAIQDRLRVSDHSEESVSRLLDRLDDAAILVDRTGVTLSANLRAQHIAAERDGLTLDEARIGGTSPAATRRLRAAIAAVATTGEPRRLLLERRPPRAPLLVDVMPAGVAGARVVIFFTAPDAPVVIDRAAVARAFGLTPRESDVAALVAEGCDLRDISDRLALGLGTVRFHLSRVFDKVGVHSQAKLVALLRGFAGRPRYT